MVVGFIIKLCFKTLKVTTKQQYLNFNYCLRSQNKKKLASKTTNGSAKLSHNHVHLISKGYSGSRALNIQWQLSRVGTDIPPN